MLNPSLEKLQDFYSAKRQLILDQTVDLLCRAQKSKKLKDACRTWWIDQMNSYVVFLELLPAIVMALWTIVCPNQFENIRCDWNWDGETKASRFIPLNLQMQAGDVFYAYKQVTVIVDILKGWEGQKEGSHVSSWKRPNYAKTYMGKTVNSECPE